MNLFIRFIMLIPSFILIKIMVSRYMDNKKNINIEIIQNYTQDMINITEYYTKINKAEYYTEINKPEYYKQEPRTNHIMTIYYLFEPIQLMGI